MKNGPSKFPNSPQNKQQRSGAKKTPSSPEKRKAAADALNALRASPSAPAPAPQMTVAADQAEAKKMIKELERKNQSLVEENTEQKARIAELEKQVKSIHGQLLTAEGRFEPVIRQQKQEIAQLKKQLQDNKATSDNRDKEKRELQNKILRLEKKLPDEIGALRASEKQFKKDAETAHGTVLYLREQLANSQKEVILLQAQIQKTAAQKAIEPPKPPLVHKFVIENGRLESVNGRPVKKFSVSDVRSRPDLNKPR